MLNRSGGAGVLLQKKPSKVEVYNDLDGHVCEFFEVLRDKPWELISLVTLYPYSRQLYEEWKNSARTDTWPDDKVKRVAMWFYIQRATFSGKPLAGWAYGKTKNNAAAWSNTIARLIEVSNRLHNVQVENKDFREVIETYDSVETLFYCDPPYFQAKSDYYRCGFSLKDHDDLAELLNNVNGKVCLSYYPHPKVDELYPDWRRTSKETVVYSFGITKHQKAKKRPKRVELLLMNY